MLGTALSLLLGFASAADARGRAGGALDGGLDGVSDGARGRASHRAYGAELELDEPRTELDEPLRLDPPMRRWLRWHVTGRSRAETARQKLVRLDRALHAAAFGLVEVEDGSADAREVFARREADCVGYAFLFAAFARELDVEVDFVVEEKIDSIEERPGFRIVRRHLAVAHRESGTVFDRAGPQPIRSTDHERIDLAAAVAILESNRGTEALLAGEVDEAVDHLRLAVRTESTLAFAWRNLAVALRRSGDDAGAASAWARARELEAAESGSPKASASRSEVGSSRR